MCGDIDLDCVTHCVLKLMEMFAQQFLNDDSDLTAGKEVQAAATFICTSLQAIRSRKKADVWGTPGGLPPVQVIRSHILHYLSSYYDAYALVYHCNNIP